MADKHNPHGQAGAKIGEGGQDPDKARQEAERVARIVAQKQHPHGQAGAKIGEGGQDPDKDRQETERRARNVVVNTRVRPPRVPASRATNAATCALCAGSAGLTIWRGTKTAAWRA